MFKWLAIFILLVWNVAIKREMHILEDEIVITQDAFEKLSIIVIGLELNNHE